MALLRALEAPQDIVTAEGKIRLTHEAYCYTIVPYSFPPIQVKRVKGYIDRMGRFRPVLPFEAGFEINQDEFRQLISPTPQGKPAGDFRISDVVALWRKRTQPASLEMSEADTATLAKTAATSSQGPESAAPAASPRVATASETTAPQTSAGNPVAKGKAA